MTQKYDKDISAYTEALNRKYKSLGVARPYSDAISTLEEIKTVVREEEEKIASLGIGLNEGKSDFVINVDVHDIEKSISLPEFINGIRIVKRRISKIKQL